MKTKPRIVVNTICKNEIINIDKWLKSCQNADLIYVLDTGSDDGTIDVLKNNKTSFDVDKSFEENGIFNFGKARNKCLENARILATKQFKNEPIIYVCIDIDEFPTEDAFDVLRSSYSNDYDAYPSWCIMNGERSIIKHKIISDNQQWEWVRSIHETTVLKGNDNPKYHPTPCFTYIHEQDLTKDRKYYLYTKHAYEKNPNNSLNCIYYACECYHRGDYDLFKKLNEEYIEVLLNNKDDIRYQDAEHLILGYLNLVDYYLNIDIKPTMALVYSTKVEQIIKDGKFPKFRKHYYVRALIFELMRQYKSAELNLVKAYNVEVGPCCFVDDLSYYNENGNYVIEEKLIKIRKHISNQQNSVNKICVYAICRNEKQFVEKWLESMSEADYIVVLDTGSTDGTYEMLKNDPRVYSCEQKIISPWRFDVARNEGMLLIPDDANILLSTDLDEILEPGWAKVIRDKWDPKQHVRGDYKYAWSHNDSGEPGRIFYYDKLHDRNWYWTAPVHELLTSELYDDDYRYSHEIDLFNHGVYLHHYPDQTKSRSNYLPLLELRAKETPEDYYGLYYLSHEYYYRGQYENSIKVLNKILDCYSDKFSDDERAAAYLFIGDNYRALQDLIKAIYYYNRAIDVDKTYRESYLSIAEICNELGMYNVAIGYVNEAIQKTYRHYTWIERDRDWNEQVDDILSVSYSWLGDFETAHTHIKKALAKNPNDTRLQSNYQLIAEQLLEN